MKKTLFTLSALAMAASSAQAYTILDNQASGTKVDFVGSARLAWKSTSDKEMPVNGRVTREHINHAVVNDGSRFGLKVNQQLGNDFYALGRVEWRFRGSAPSQHNFDDIYTRQLYAGIGHKQYGELTYGHQAVITDDLKFSDLANTLSLTDGFVHGAARKTVQYVYKGIEGLKVGAFYGDHSKRGNNALDLSQDRKHVWGSAAIYEQKIDDVQSFAVGAGFSREFFNATSTKSDYDTTAYDVTGSYTFDKTTLALDLARKTTNDKGAIGNKATDKEVTATLFQEINSDWNAYTMYSYKTSKENGGVSKAKTHEFMLGTEYYIVPKHLKTFVEWQTAKTKNYENGVKTSKVRNNTTVIGLRAYW